MPGEALANQTVRNNSAHWSTGGLTGSSRAQSAGPQARRLRNQLRSRASSLETAEPPADYADEPTDETFLHDGSRNEPATGAERQNPRTIRDDDRRCDCRSVRQRASGGSGSIVAAKPRAPGSRAPRIAGYARAQAQDIATNPQARGLSAARKGQVQQVAARWGHD